MWLGKVEFTACLANFSGDNVRKCVLVYELIRMDYNFILIMAYFNQYTEVPYPL